MKYVKMLGLATVAAAALMAFVGASSASATVLCKTNTGKPTGRMCEKGWTYPAGTELHAVNEGSVALTTGSEYNEITCKKSTLVGKTDNEGSATETVHGKVEKLTFEECSTSLGFCTVTTVKPGTLEVHWIEGTHNGTITSNGAEITTSCNSMVSPIHCIWQAANEDIGTLTGGNPATSDSEDTPVNQISTSSFCPTEPKLDAKYEITSPKPLYVAGPGSGGSGSGSGVLCKVQGMGSVTGTACPVGEAYPKETELHAVSEGNLVLTTGSEITEITCKKSTMAGKTENEGSAAEAVKGKVEKLTWEECATPNGSCTVTTVKPGTLAVEWIEGTHNGTLASNGAEITSSCASIFGNIHCIYVMEERYIGTLTGGNPATSDSEATPINQASTSGLCPAAPTWDAKYEMTSPKPLYVAEQTTPRISSGVLCKAQGTGASTGTACPAGEAYPKETEIHAASEGNLVLTTGSEFTEITCKKSTVTGKTENEGSATEAVKGNVEKLTWEECSTPNGKCTVTTVNPGTLEIEWIENTHNGTLETNKTEITSSCASIFGTIHCIYQPATGNIGTLTGGNPATSDIEKTPISIVSTSGLCPAAPTWDAKYEITSPKPLYVAGHT